MKTVKDMLGIKPENKYLYFGNPRDATKNFPNALTNFNSGNNSYITQPITAPEFAINVDPKYPEQQQAVRDYAQAFGTNHSVTLLFANNPKSGMGEVFLLQKTADSTRPKEAIDFDSKNKQDLIQTVQSKPETMLSYGGGNLNEETITSRKLDLTDKDDQKIINTILKYDNLVNNPHKDEYLVPPSERYDQTSAIIREKAQAKFDEAVKNKLLPIAGVHGLTLLLGAYSYSALMSGDPLGALFGLGVALFGVATSAEVDLHIIKAIYEFKQEKLASDQIRAKVSLNKLQK
ncbi:hypothetical protein KBC75_00770 [Candidatus Shapirobacteria bacterium]|nr:hypothetical protein [Candidatus Shapirobacteria bacterium]